MWYRHNDQLGIYKQAIDEQTAERLDTGPQNAAHPRVSPDGASILYLSVPRTGPTKRRRLMRIPVDGGVPQFVLELDNWENYQCGSAPDSCIVVELSDDGNQSFITAFDPMKGRGRLLKTVPSGLRPGDYGNADDVSPDGKTYAIARDAGSDTRIQLVSLSNDIPDREVIVKGWTNFSNLDWAPDGKGIYCGIVSPNSRTLLYVDLKGTAHVLKQYRGHGAGLFWGLPSPDGRYIAIPSGSVDGNVWMLRGF